MATVPTDEQAILLKKPQYVVNSQGERVGVLLDMETFRQLMRQLEDVMDNRLMAEAEDEERFPLEEALREEEARRGL